MMDLKARIELVSTESLSKHRAENLILLFLSVNLATFIYLKHNFREDQ